MQISLPRLVAVWLAAIVTQAGAIHTAQAEVTTARELRVLVLATPDYRLFHRDWRERSASIVQGASRRLEDGLALRLNVVDTRGWDYAGGRSPASVDGFLDQLLHVVPEKADVVVAFTLVTYGGPQPGAEVRGFTQPFGQHVVIPDQWTARGAETRLVHEVCHVLGAFHDAEPRSIMWPAFAGLPQQYEFSAATRAVVDVTRSLDMARGVEGLGSGQVAMLRALYRRYRHPREGAERDPVTMGRDAALHRAEITRDADRTARLQAWTQTKLAGAAVSP